MTVSPFRMTDFQGRETDKTPAQTFAWQGFKVWVASGDTNPISTPNSIYLGSYLNLYLPCIYDEELS
jgi:hypothetical protein